MPIDATGFRLVVSADRFLGDIDVPDDFEPYEIALPEPPSTAEARGLLDDRTVRVGAAAPDFELAVLGDTKPLRLSDLRGSVVVLNFWASWVPPSRAEMPEFQALWEERGPSGSNDLVILAVDFLPEDTVSAAAGFVEDFALTFPILFDTEDGEVAQRYGVRGLPATFFIDGDGIIRAINLGPVFGDLLLDGIAKADAGGAETSSRGSLSTAWQPGEKP